MSEPSKEVQEATKQWTQHYLFELLKWGDIVITEDGKILHPWEMAENEFLKEEKNKRGK